MLLSEQIEVWSIRLPVEPAMLRALEAVHHFKEYDFLALKVSQ